MRTAEAVKNAVIGALMGMFMLLPGASGATIAVVFGVYERLILDISSIRKHLTKDLPFLITLGIGGLIGVLICAKGLDFFIEKHEIPLMFFFAALIAVQIPDIMKQGSDGEGVTKYNIAAFISGFLIMMAVLWIGLNADETGAGDIGPAFMFLAGIIYAVCALSPGISGSTILLALGLFSAVITGLTTLNLACILPLLAGAVIGVLAFAKTINYCVHKHRKSTYSAILGLTAGSIVTVIAEAVAKMNGGDYTAECVIYVAAGLIIGYLMHLLSRYLSEKEGESP